MAQTFYWHDYETFGLNTRLDRPAQFAGIRTDMNFNPIGKPDVWYCEVAPDYLPSPQAVFVTGITPQLVHEKKGAKEVDFARAIENAMSVPETISVGYNNFHYDDEITRFMLWRNLLDPYAREYANQCSRWDLFPFTLAVWALRPEGINWPEVPDEERGKRPSFKLEELTRANHLDHSHAHDAASDVQATIALARLFATKQPRLWSWALKNKGKDAVVATLQSGRPVVWIDRAAGIDRGFIRVVMPLCGVPGRRNDMLVWDLSEDPTQLQGLTPEAIAQRMRFSGETLPEGKTYLPIYRIKINASPFVCSDLRILTPQVIARFKIDINAIVQNGEKLTKIAGELIGPVSMSFKEKEDEAVPDADAALYAGFVDGFEDKEALKRVHTFLPTDLTDAVKDGRVHFEDKRLKELLFRMRARNWPESLTEAEQIQWKAFCQWRLNGGVETAYNLTTYFEAIDNLATQNEDDLLEGRISDAEHDRKQALCEELYAWGEYVAECANGE